MHEYATEAVKPSEHSASPERAGAVEEVYRRELGQISVEGWNKAEAVKYNPLQDIEDNLKETIVGQSEAIESIISALSREQFRNPNRPLANLLFLGPTGVGKSETAKELARQLHDDDNEAFIKIDCSSFSQGHEITALVGAPPSFVGREQKPIFDPDIIETEKSVILFDEIEKGSRRLHDLMLQIMDDGEVTLTGTGQVVSFRNSIIIMTSNLGATEMMGLLEPKKIGFSADQNIIGATKQQINNAATSALRDYFRPEFINRIDRRVVFTPLDDEQLAEVLDHYLADANLRYLNAGIHLQLSPELRHQLVTRSEERRQFGARPILREFDHVVESLLATHVNSGSIPVGSQVYAVVNDNAESSETSEKITFYYKGDEFLQGYMMARELRQAPEEAEPEEVLSTELLPANQE